MDQRDTIYREPKRPLEKFSFNEEVARVFEDMITRSVPLYYESQLLTIQVAQQRYLPKTTIYDLGCSTGANILPLLDTIHDPDLHIVGIDNSAPMLARAREKLSNHPRLPSVELRLESLEVSEISSASLVLLHYTLQFVPLAHRSSILKRISTALAEGGVLLMSEKIRHADPEVDSLLNLLHLDFKRRNGYSALEISQKRDALEDVLLPQTCEDHLTMLRDAGFREVEVAAKCYNFATFLAIR